MSVHTVVLDQGKTFPHRTAGFQESFFPSAITGLNSLDLDVDVQNSISAPTFKAKLRSVLFPYQLRQTI